MAVIRETTNEVFVEKISAIVLLLGVMCSVLLFKFKGFKVNFNLTSGKSFGTEFNSGPGISGKYRTHKEENNGYGHMYSQNPQAKLPKSVANPPPRPSMVNLPQNAKLNSGVVERATKSTGDLTQSKHVPVHSNSTPDVSCDPAEKLSNNKNSMDTNKVLKTNQTANQKRGQKNIERRRVAEQKKREKIEAQQRAKQEKMAAKEQAKQEKIRKEREKQEAKMKLQQAKSKKTPQPRMNPLAQTSTQYSTNTLESSISKTSGPPPYTEPQRAKPEVIPNENDDTGNTSFSKRPSMFSWDKIAQHKQHINRSTAAGTSSRKITKQTVLDLNFENKPRNSIYV